MLILDTQSADYTLMVAVIPVCVAFRQFQLQWKYDQPFQVPSMSPFLTDCFKIHLVIELPWLLTKISYFFIIWQEILNDRPFWYLIRLKALKVSQTIVSRLDTMFYPVKKPFPCGLFIRVNRDFVVFCKWFLVFGNLKLTDLGSWLWNIVCFVSWIGRIGVFFGWLFVCCWEFRCSR